MGNTYDNCPNNSNANQKDSDGDDEGNACEDSEDDPTGIGARTNLKLR